MSKAHRGFVPYCATYHCAGDCGLPHSQEERAQQFTGFGSAEERKRLTLCAWDDLHHEAARDAKEKRAEKLKITRRKFRRSSGGRLPEQHRVLFLAFIDSLRVLIKEQGGWAVELNEKYGKS